MFRFLRKVFKPIGPKPGVPVPKQKPAYVPGPPASSGPQPSATFAEPIVHPPGYYRPEYKLPHYTPRKIEGLEDVDLAPTFGPRAEVALGRGRSPIGGSTSRVQQPEEWLPKYPKFAHEDRTLFDLDDEGGSWIPAPAESHVESFRYLPARVRPRTPWKGVVEDVSGWSFIDIRFKPTARHGTWEYRYYFPPGEQWMAEDIWLKLIASAHPGEIVWEYLIRLEVKYKRVGQQ